MCTLCGARRQVERRGYGYASGLSRKSEFSRRHGISCERLYKWRRMYGSLTVDEAWR